MRSLLVALALVLVLPAFGVGGWLVTTHTIADTPQRVRLAPLDADALPDLVYTAGEKGFQVPNTLSVWRNMGAGSFERHWRASVITDFGDNGVPLEVADVDENGLADLILGNANGTSGFLVRLGDGSGSFPDESFGPSYGGYIDDVTVADYDGDGHLDVGTTTLDFGWYVDRFDGDGTGNFTSNLPFTSYGGGAAPHELASGDVTGDGLPNDVVTGQGGMWLFMPTGFLPKILSIIPHDRAVVADLDGDGLGDIAATAPLDHSIQVLMSLGNGNFAPPTRTPTGRRPAGLVQVDLDLDGDLDLAVTNAAGRSLSLLVNTGSGRFEQGAHIGVGSGPIDVAAADLDEDGDMDLVVANAGDDSISVLINPLN